MPPANTDLVTGSQPAAQSPQQFGRFGQPAQDQTSFPGAKPFDSFGQQPPGAAQGQFEGGFQNQQPPRSRRRSAAAGRSVQLCAERVFLVLHRRSPESQRVPTAITTRPTASRARRDSRRGLSQQQQRAFGGYTAQSDNLSQYPQSAAHRFGTGSATAARRCSEQRKQTLPTPRRRRLSSGLARLRMLSSSSLTTIPTTIPTSTTSTMPRTWVATAKGYNQGAYGAPHGKGAGLGYGQPNQFGMSPQGPQWLRLPLRLADSASPPSPRRQRCWCWALRVRTCRIGPVQRPAGARWQLLWRYS